MKTDLVTSIGIAVVGVLFAYFICNMFIGPLDSFSFSTLDPNSKISADVEEPNAEIFNYKALNATVEVIVGDCQDYAEGECLDDVANQNLNEDQ